MLISAFSTVAPAEPLGHFKHFRWTVEDGAPAIVGMAQSSDGYIWIASPSGLFRFDGVTFERIPSLDPSTDYDPVTAVAPARDGGVWVGYQNNGIARYRGGELIDMRFPKEARPIQITAIVEDRDGSLWVTIGRGEQPLWRYARGRWEPIGTRWGFSRFGSTSLLLGHDGTLWVATIDALLFRPPGATRFRTASIKFSGLGTVAEDYQGRVWFFDDAGARPVTARARFDVYPTPGHPRRPQAIFAADGSIWGKTLDEGIYRLADPRPTEPASRKTEYSSVEYYDQSHGLSSNGVNALLSDREGNIWVGTSLGLDMFKRADVVLEPALAEPTPFGAKVVKDTLGNVYVGQEKSLWRIPPGGTPALLLRYSHLAAMCPGPAGELWAVLPEGILRIPNAWLKPIPLPPLPEHGAIYDCAIDRTGALWVTAGADGLYRRTKSGWAHFPIDPAAADPDPTVAVLDPKGRLVTQYRAGLFSIIDFPRRIAVDVSGSSASKDARTLASVRTGLIAAGDFGLLRWKEGKVQRLLATRHPWLTGIRGVTQTDRGETWLGALPGAIRIATSEFDRALARPNAALPVRIFDFRDGLPALFVGASFRSIVEGGDGRLWLVTRAGVAWLDPRRLSRNRVPPTVLIRALATNGTRYRDPHSVKLAPGTSSVEIDYTATSLRVPSRVQFRYRLIGLDGNWIDPGGRRQAFFTNLRPGAYSFEVMASNDDGVWSRQGAVLRFVIPPTFWQSWWFFSLCAIACLALLWFLYSVRMRQVSAVLRSRLEERIGERERIARELHDTLLQGVQGLIFRFQSIAGLMPRDEPIREMMEKALDRADEIMVEGRERVSTLRSAEAGSDLHRMLIAAAASAVADSQIGSRVTVRGEPRAIPSVTAEEVFRIAQEALFNAVMHAKASVIEISIAFERNGLEVRVSDDGVGLDQSVLEAGSRSGHYGLIGMRERAERMHGTLTLSSRPGAGTEVTVAVPPAYAYVQKQRRGRRPTDPETGFGK